MNRRQLETLLVTLESTPVLLERSSSEIPVSLATRRPAGGGFSLVENVWHLADLEIEGYGARIRRLLAEEDPVLANFDGDRIATERNYQGRDLAEGLASFAAARRRNLEMLRTARASDWRRRGTHETLGRVTLEDLPRMMAEHDRGHTDAVGALLAEIKGEAAPARSHPTSAVA
jgi:hypothetical protein